jgi:quercetin dioxygenase-like cupin family protein
MSTQAKYLGDGEGSSRWILGQLMTYKVRGETDGYSIFEFTSGPGAGAPPHFHRFQDETHYVIRGQYEFLLDDKMLQAGPGSVVFVPKGTVHAFTNIGAESGTLLFIETPSGALEEFMDAIGEPIDDPAVPPQGAPDMDKIVAAAERTGGIDFAVPVAAGY